MDGFFSIPNWESFQHYKHRSPPWIKLHKNVVFGYDFTKLTDKSKLHIILIWMLASEFDNKIPADHDFIKSKIGVSDKIDFKELISKGFLIDASTMLADCKQVAIPETETKLEQSRVEQSREEYIVHTSLVDDAVSEWNLSCETTKLSKVQALNDKRRKSIKERLKECGGIEGWKIALSKIQESDFLMGRNDRGWKPNIDFFLRQDKFIKLMEDGYATSSNKIKTQQQQDQEDIYEFVNF